MFWLSFNTVFSRGERNLCKTPAFQFSYAWKSHISSQGTVDVHLIAPMLTFLVGTYSCFLQTWHLQTFCIDFWHYTKKDKEKEHQPWLPEQYLLKMPIKIPLNRPYFNHTLHLWLTVRLHSVRIVSPRETTSDHFSTQSAHLKGRTHQLMAQLFFLLSTKKCWM